MSQIYNNWKAEMAERYSDIYKGSLAKCRGRTIKGDVNVSLSPTNVNPECMNCQTHFSTATEPGILIPVVETPVFVNSICPELVKKY